MIKSFHNMKYCVWNVNLYSLKNNTKFNDEIEERFNIQSEVSKRPPEAQGDAYSIGIKSMDTFDELMHFLIPAVNPYHELLANRNIIGVTRCWANRMNKDSSGAIHTHHKQIKILILYYNVPENSGDLVFVDPKYKDVLNTELIPDSDKLHIQVSEGTCILYDGEIPHGVSRHKSDESRDAFIFELF